MEFSGVCYGEEMTVESNPPLKRRHPEWLKVRAPFGERTHELKKLMGGLSLSTVCQEAMCPNMGECWSHGVATFMILGDICTRGCRYCAVSKGKPLQLDRAEPDRVARAVEIMGLKHAVVTSVDRDDVPDGGAEIFARTIEVIRGRHPACVVEVLIPDFQGSEASLETVLDAGPEVLAHNIETVPRLYPRARAGGDYQRSLELLGRAHTWKSGVVTKTGMMLGLGEKEDEIRRVLEDLAEKKVRILTIGQYLRPTPWHLPVASHYHPDEFQFWKEVGEKTGFQHVESGPLVRSSYLADRQFAQLKV